MPMSRREVFGLLVLAVSLLPAIGCGPSAVGKSMNSTESGSASSSGKPAGEPIELLNVSYDPTRELWKDINQHFEPAYTKKTGTPISIKQSHGGSSGQARAVIDGLEADVVSLALATDTDAISKAGLIKEGWEERLPNASLPYWSTIVFVVRKGNPKGIKDWSDLVQNGVEIITPSPKTSGNGKLSFLSAWGSVVTQGGTPEKARKFVTELYKRVPVLDSGARAATSTFAQKKIGDVHLTWENEAYFETEESKGELEIVYPSTSIRAEPRVAVVDVNVDRKKGHREAAVAYLEFLYTDEGQEIIAKHHYRPSNPEILKQHSETFPKLKLFTIQQIAPNRQDADEKFFAEGGVFDEVYSAASKQ